MGRSREGQSRQGRHAAEWGEAREGREGEKQRTAPRVHSHIDREGRSRTLSSKVSSVRAAFRIFDRAICTRQSSRLLRSPYSPTNFSSASSRSFSYGRRGFLNVLPSAEQSDGH